MKIAEEIETVQKRYKYKLFGSILPKSSSKCSSASGSNITVYHKISENFWIDGEDKDKLTSALEDFMKLSYKRLPENLKLTSTKKGT